MKKFMIVVCGDNGPSVSSAVTCIDFLHSQNDKSLIPLLRNKKEVDNTLNGLKRSYEIKIIRRVILEFPGGKTEAIEIIAK